MNGQAQKDQEQRQPSQDSAIEPAQVRPFAAVLQETRHGGLHSELSEQLAEVVEAVLKHRKAGALTLTLAVKPSEVPGAVTVNDEIKAKVPKGDKPAALFYADDNGNLSRRDPRQPELPLREVRGAVVSEREADPQ